LVSNYQYASQHLRRMESAATLLQKTHNLHPHLLTAEAMV